MASMRLTAARVVATTVAISAASLIVAGSSATADEIPPTINCPATTAAVGFPIDSTRLAESNVQLGVSGSGLPSGISLQDGPDGSFLMGTPTEAGASTITLVGTTTDDGDVTEICEITVRAAPNVTRIAGADRYTQAVAVSAGNFDRADIVFVASGEKFADALSATAVAAAKGGPLLLTTANAVPAAVIAEINRLSPKRVVVVGGPNSVSPAAVAQLEGSTDATVTQIGGADRYEVSRNLISSAAFGIAKSEKLYIATGTNFPDALTASPAAAKVNAPVLLVNGLQTALTTAERALFVSLGVRNVLISGGPMSVSAALEADLRESYVVNRHTGADRFDVGVAVNKASFGSASTIYLASGTAFADALSGGVVAGLEQNPLYVTNSSCVSAQVFREIGRLAPRSVIVLGGTNTLSADVEHLMSC